MKIEVGFLLFKDNKNKLKEFKEEYRPYLSKNISLKIMETHDWAGQVPSKNVMNKARGFLRTPCQQPFNLCFLYTNGDVVPCCIDMNSKYLGGKFPDQSIKEIWNGGVFRGLRERLLRGKIGKNELCYNCHYYRQSLRKTLRIFLLGKTVYNWEVKK